MKHIYTCKSKIHGMGLNVGENTTKREVISRIKGEMRFMVNESVSDALNNPDWVGIKKNQWIDPAKPYKFLNHSCNPSAGIKGKVTLVALRDLKEGEEITIDYSTIEADERWNMKCHCGYRYCRGIIRSIQHLPKKRFISYHPFIPVYFAKIYKSYDHSKI